MPGFLSFDAPMGFRPQMRLHGHFKKFRHATLPPRSVALIVGSFDDLPLLQQVFGQAAAERYIRIVLAQLPQAIHTPSVVARVGEDRFAILVAVNDRSSLETSVAIIQRQVATPVTVDGHELGSSTYLGIALYPDDGDTFQAVFQHATTAMVYARKDLRHDVLRYRPWMIQAV